MMPLLEKLIPAINSAGKIPGLHLSDWSKIEYLQRLGVRYFTVSASISVNNACHPEKDFLLDRGQSLC